MLKLLVLVTLLAGAVGFGQEARSAVLRTGSPGSTEEVPAEPVITRAWAHDEFGRLVFDWPRPVRYEAGTESRTLIVMFDTRLTTTFEQVERHLGGYIAYVGLSPDRRSVRAELTGAFRLRTFTLSSEDGDTKVVVDLLAEGGADFAQAPAALPPEPSPAAPPGDAPPRPTISGGSPLLTPAYDVSDVDVGAGLKPAPATPEASPSEDGDGDRGIPLPGGVPRQRRGGLSSTEAPEDAEPSAEQTTGQNADQATVPPAETETPTPHPPRPAATPPRRGEDAAEDAEPVITRASAQDDFGRIVFDWPRAVEYEAGIQDDTLTVVFATPLRTTFWQVERYLDAYISEVDLSPDGRRVTAALNGAYELRAFTLSGEDGMTRVVVDLLAEGGADLNLAQVPAALSPEPPPEAPPGDASPPPTISGGTPLPPSSEQAPPEGGGAEGVSSAETEAPTDDASEVGAGLKPAPTAAEDVAPAQPAATSAVETVSTPAAPTDPEQAQEATQEETVTAPGVPGTVAEDQAAELTPAPAPEPEASDTSPVPSPPGRGAAQQRGGSPSTAQTPPDMATGVDGPDPPRPPATPFDAAQDRPPERGEDTADATPEAEAPPLLSIPVSQSRLFRLDTPVASVVVANPDIADVQLVSSGALFVLGKAVGRTSVATLDADSRLIAEWTIATVIDVEPVRAALAEVDDLKQVAVRQLNRGVELSGTVASIADADLALRLTTTALPEEIPVENRIAVSGAQQINLEVQIAEVQRNVSETLGINWEVVPNLDGDSLSGFRVGRLFFDQALGGFLSQDLQGGRATAAFGAGTAGRTTVRGLIDALATAGLATVLARPNVTAISGETASFFSGGEYPLPAGYEDGAIIFEYKKYGVLLDFVPTIVDSGRIVLTVRPEVSERSETDSLTVTGLEIPVINVRRAETTVEVGDGESIVIAGLYRDQSEATEVGVPVLKDIPLLNLLFGTRTVRSNATELIVVVTARLTAAARVSQPASRQAPGRRLRGYHY